MASTVRVLQSFGELESINGLAVLYFWADWSKPCGQMMSLCEQLAVQFPDVSFYSVEAERISLVTEHFDISAVPYVVLLNGGKKVFVVEGANPPELTRKVRELSQEKPIQREQAAAPPPSQEAPPAESLDQRLGKLVNKAPVMLFMKGTPEAPQCGFSGKIVKILQDHKAQFSSFNILSDQEVREGLKKYSNWPTFPQLYVNGKLIGGLDIVKELAEDGELKNILPAPQEDLNSRLEKLIKSSRVILFMKGTPESPSCGFSGKIVKILQEAQCSDFGSFNILSDQEVREGLKKYSNWPTYPQLYVNGKLIGGLDIVKELHEDGELSALLAAP